MVHRKRSNPSTDGRAACDRLHRPLEANTHTALNLGVRNSKFDSALRPDTCTRLLDSQPTVETRWDDVFVERHRLNENCSTRCAEACQGARRATASHGGTEDVNTSAVLREPLLAPRPRWRPIFRCDLSWGPTWHGRQRPFRVTSSPVAPALRRFRPASLHSRPIDSVMTRGGADRSESGAGAARHAFSGNLAARGSTAGAAKVSSARLPPQVSREWLRVSDVLHTHTHKDRRVTRVPGTGLP